ncbi:thrombin-like enzyme halystase isoform X2 [Cimex lectularius]|nr:thrombin-like enzyme halystase isoform X2 [Cimex lectularius]XP_014246367.1 thrombin-like enzyme halystase isoform X2 [Cimex lectularius]XP_024083787.1 thrombin-like enzyme halystase isoform X2 [Cimex lectularius]
MAVHEQTDRYSRLGNMNLSSTSMRPLIRRKRLTGGIETFPNEAMMVGSLQRKLDRTHFCGVTLITMKHGVTACSCAIFGLPTDADLPQGTDFVVMAGDKQWNTKDKTRIRDVKSFWRDYRCRMDEDAGIWKFGIGYFELSLPFPSAGGPEYASGIPTTQAEYEKAFKKYYENVKFSQGSVTDYCYTYGWGAKKYDVKSGDPTIFPPALNKRAMQFLSMKDCQDRLCSHGFCSFKIEKIGAVCLGVPDNSNGGVCKGDAGNPLMCGNKFFGVGEEAPDCGNILRFAIFYKLDISVIQTLKNGAAPSPFSHRTRTQWFMIGLTLVTYVTV